MKRKKQGIIDIHAHILPGVDDGAGTLEESIETLLEAQRQNIQVIIATPHHHPGRYVVTPSRIYEQLELLREECRKREIDIRLYPGQECYYYSGLADQLLEGNVLTLAGSRYVLVEFEPDCIYSYMSGGLRELQSCGYRPVLAHFERYRCLRDRERLYELKERGILLQMNFDTLIPKGNIFCRNPWRQIAADGLVDCLGSDCHGMHFRPLQTGKAVSWLQTGVRQELLEELLYDCAAEILEKQYR